MRKTRPGFSFFETILYLALFSVLAVGLFHFSFDVLDLGTKDRTNRQVFSDARFVAERMKYFIRNASGIDENASILDDANGKIVLEQVGSSDTVTISIDDGVVALTQANHPGASLSSPDSRVQSLTFQKYGTDTDGSEYVGFVLVLESAGNDTTAPSAYEATTTLRGGASIRNSGIGL